MNFIEGTASRTDGLTFRSKGGGLTLKLDTAYNDRLKNHLDRNIWIGIRPEDIYDSAETAPRNSFRQVETKLEVVEPMGNEIFLYFTIDGVQVVARIPAREKPQAGSTTPLFIDTEKLHFFDASTEEVIK
jgi:multiple sugar transport system ATP-binding protein